MVNFIKALILVVTFNFPADLFSQPFTLKVFFSVTGDTICYSDAWGTKIDSLRFGYEAHIKRRVQKGEPETLSTFIIPCDESNNCASNTCLDFLNTDTIKKYNLQLDGNIGGWSSFVISVKPSGTKIVDTSAFGPKFIYQTLLIVSITCKGQELYSKQFEVMFKGNSPKDFPERDFVRINSWHKKSKNRFFVDLSVKEFQIFKKPTDTEYSNFKNFQFIF